MESADLKLLICYVLSSLKAPLPGDDLCRTLSGDGIAGYFDLSDSVDELCRDGFLTLTEDGCFVTERGQQTASSFGLKLPATMRDRAVESCLRLMAARRQQSETPCEITPLPGGDFSVSLSVRDGADDLMKILLRVGDRAQADALVRRFQNDPMLTYTGVIALLTGDLDSVGGRLLSNPQNKS